MYRYKHLPSPHMHTPKQTQQKEKISFICLCVLIFSLGKYDYFRHFLLVAPRNVFRVQFHKQHFVLKFTSGPFFPLLADKM